MNDDYGDPNMRGYDDAAKVEAERLTTCDLLGVLHNYVLSQGAIHMAKLVDHIAVRVGQMESELHLRKTVG